jgi:cardiolipin synthase
MVIDDRWVSLGSANLDMRSLQKSQEANLNVIGTPLAHQLKEIFLRDLVSSRAITMEQFTDRSLSSRILEILFGMVESQL